MELCLRGNTVNNILLCNKRVKKLKVVANLFKKKLFLNVFKHFLKDVFESCHRTNRTNTREEKGNINLFTETESSTCVDETL